MIDLSTFKKILTFFAHPDDETLAAGGTIHKLIQLGADVHVAIPSKGIDSRRNKLNEVEVQQQLTKLRNDCCSAVNKLGVLPQNIYFGDFPDNEMDKRTLLELIHWLENIIEKIKPDLILTHHRECTNIDHQYCHNAVVVATRPNTTNHTAVLCCEVPSSTGYLKPTQWEPNFFISLSPEDLKAKIDAMNTFESEVRPFPHPRSSEVIEALAKIRGAESGFHLAESFMISKFFG